MSQAKSHSIAVTIHDQELLLEYEAANKFGGQTSDLVYVFVGNRPVDKVANLDNVIVARDLPDHIEDYKYLVDFTTWYAIVNNDIATGDFISLIQYDVAVADDFSSASRDLMDAAPDIILGYSPVPMKSRDFIRDNMGFAPLRAAILKTYSIDIKAVLRKYQRVSTDPDWPSTNNVAMSRETLVDFVRWFTPVAKAMGNYKPSGHAFERAIKVYSILSGRANKYAPHLLSHYQLNSHGTQAFSEHEMASRKDRLKGTR